LVRLLEISLRSLFLHIHLSFVHFWLMEFTFLIQELDEFINNSSLIMKLDVTIEMVIHLEILHN